MSLPDASGQVRTALMLMMSGACARVAIGASGLIGKRLPRVIAAILDIAAFALSAGLCAFALFLSGGEARLTAFILFFCGLLIACLPMIVYRRRQEKRRLFTNTKEHAKEG